MSHWKELAESCVAGRRWLVAQDVSQAACFEAQALLDLGAEDVLAIAASRGTGPAPQLADDRLWVLGVRGSSMMDALRVGDRALDDVPAQVQQAVDQFDPRAEARVLRAFFSRGKPVAGRACFGARPESWQALEDKTVVDSLWDEARVERAPFVVVPVSGAAAAAKNLDRGAGTVWAGDSREGFNGGASLTRWVQDGDDARRAEQLLAQHCDQVRVMPFLEGLPCSIHAMIAPGCDHILTLRPMEMLVLRGDKQGFVYCGASPTWQASDPDRQALREVARRVGEHLRASYDYRGAFTVDGVLTREGFLPTELNPRWGAALNAYQREDIPLLMLNFAMIEGLKLDWRLEQLENELLRHIEQPRDFRCGVPMDGLQVSEEKSLELVFDPHPRPARAAEESHVKVLLGPMGGGAYLRLFFSGAHIPWGNASLAPRLALAIELVREDWQLPLDELRPAPVW